MVTPTDCDPFDGFILRIDAGPAVRDQPQPVHPDGSELRPLRRTGPAGLDGNPGLRRHAVRPLPGSQSGRIPRIERRDPVVFADHAAEHAALPHRSRGIHPGPAERRARPTAGHGSVLRIQPEQPQSEFPQCALRQLPRRRHVDRPDQRRQRPADDGGLRSRIPDAGIQAPAQADRAPAPVVRLPARGGDQRQRRRQRSPRPGGSARRAGCERRVETDRRRLHRRRHVQHRRAPDRRGRAARRPRSLGVAAVAGDADVEEPRRNDPGARQRAADLQPQRAIRRARPIAARVGCSRARRRIPRSIPASPRVRSLRSFRRDWRPGSPRRWLAARTRRSAKSPAGSIRSPRSRCWTAISTSSVRSIRRRRATSRRTRRWAGCSAPGRTSTRSGGWATPRRRNCATSN